MIIMKFHIESKTNLNKNKIMRIFMLKFDRLILRLSSIFLLCSFINPMIIDDQRNSLNTTESLSSMQLPSNTSNVTFIKPWSLNNNCSTFETILKQYPSEQVCHFNIDIYGPHYWNTSSSSIMEQYARCHIIFGYVSLRNIFYSPFNNLSNDLVFTNLEYIKDFLLVHNVSSENNDVDLGRVFPRLRRIYGYKRIENLTLYISNYESSDQIFLQSLQEVCGTVEILYSRPYFRHSETYWRIVSKYGHLKYFSNLTIFQKERVILEKSYSSNVFAARLKFDGIIDEEKLTTNKEYMLHVSIYEIDPTFYNYVQTGNKKQNVIEPLFCNLSSRLVVLSDLNYSDKQRFRMITTSYDDEELPHNYIEDIYNQPLANKPAHFEYNQRIDNFDICRLSNFGIPLHPRTGQQLLTNGTYNFTFDHIYVIKLEFCKNIFYDYCNVTDRYLFIPSRDDFQIKSNNWLFTFSIIFTLITILLLIFTVFVCKSRFWLKSLVNMDVVSVNPDYGLINPDQSLWSWPSSIHNYNGSMDNVTCEINRQNLVIFTQKLLGKGEFGYVYEGLLYDHEANSTINCTQHNSVKVAIKQLKENSDLINKEKFIIEAKYMKTFNSNFLVKLIGVSTSEEPILVIMEYMENGDLKRFLRQRYNDYLKSRNAQLLPSFEQITRMAIEIADGMHYLHSKKVIHRDLAARNCMVSSDLTVKIGDFGLTRDLYEKDYYRLSEEMPMPLRWMAPESVRKMIFTPFSDVWSYGVVLWEIMSFGEQPYRGKPDIEVKRFIANNEKLPRPFYYFEPLWNIAKQCWRKKPNHRPNFGEIIEMLYPHLTTNRQQFDNLSFYVSSRMGSYVKFSTFGTYLNHCLHQFAWRSCLQKTSATSSSSSSSTCSTSSTKPLFERRNTTDSSITNQSSTSFCSCPFRFYYRKQREPNHLPNNGGHPVINFHRQCSSSSSTSDHQMMISVNNNHFQISNNNRQQTIHANQHHHHVPNTNHSIHSTRNNNNNNNRFQYSSMESLPSSDVQSEITAITSLSNSNHHHNNNNNNMIHHLILHQDLHPVNNNNHNENNNYEIMSSTINGSNCVVVDLDNKTILSESEMPLI